MLSLNPLTLIGRAAPTLLGQSEGSFWLPPPASTTSKVVGDAFYFLLVVSAFFFTLIVVLATVFVVRYRRRPDAFHEPSPSHNWLLELVWTAIPSGIVAMVFYQGFTTYMELRTPPKDSYEIHVTAQKWQWLFTYPTGYVDEALHVPLDTPVLLTMQSEDVIHSLSIPAMSVRMDVVPGRYSRAWFRARKTGRFSLYCTEYCGTGHSDMLTEVIVHPPDEFAKWLAEAGKLNSKMTPVELGASLYRRHVCASCHSTDGSARTGPTFKGIYGRPVMLEGGGSVEVEDNYIRESILDPQAKIVAGFTHDQMPTYKGELSDKEITALIEFIKSLK